MLCQNATTIGLCYNKLVSSRRRGRLTSGLYHRFRVLIWFLSEPHCYDKDTFHFYPSFASQLDYYFGTNAKSGFLSSSETTEEKAALAATEGGFYSGV